MRACALTLAPWAGAAGAQTVNSAGGATQIQVKREGDVMRLDLRR